VSKLPHRTFVCQEIAQTMLAQSFIFLFFIILPNCWQKSTAINEEAAA
jgi:hypothetical protein